MEQEKTRLEAHNAYLLDEIRSEQKFGDIVVASVGLRKVMQQAQLVAPTDATVLIRESGTGKELVARAIHEQSARRERPLIKLNCSAVPQDFFESEFFGMSRVPLPVRSKTSPAARNSPMAVLYSSMKSAKCRSRCKPSCSACCRSRSLNGTATPARARLTYGSSPHPTAISRSKSTKVAFGRIFSTV